MTPCRVLIVDDFELLRKGIEAVLASHEGIEVVGHAEDGLEAVEAAVQLRPDVLLLDLRMERHGGMEALDSCRALVPEVRVLILTANENPANLRSAIAAGASGYLTKGTSGPGLCESVLAVARGGLVIEASLAEELIADRDGIGDPERAVGSSLSSRQRAVVRLLSAGLTDPEIAERLFISTRTVQYDVRRVKEIAGLTRRSEIARWAVINSLA